MDGGTVRGRRHRRPRGYIFVLAITTLAILTLLGVLSLRLATSNVVTARQQYGQAQAMHLAEAAAEIAEAYLRALPMPPTSNISYPTNGGVITLSDGVCNAIIKPSLSNDGSWQKLYTVVGTGKPTTGVAHTVTVQLREQSFSLYAYFSDQEVSSITSGAIWFYAGDRIYGPVHSNSQLNISWDQNGTAPIFASTVSSAATTVNWGGPGAPVSKSDWTDILSGGQAAMTLGVNAIALPSSTIEQQAAAWGGSTGFPATAGIYLPANATTLTGGIYLNGDGTVAFSVVSNNQVLTITQGSITKTITVDRPNNQTIVKQGTTSTTYQGTPNGVLYSTGNITSLQGTLADNYVKNQQVLQRNGWTIATDVNAGKDITLTGNLVYNTQPDASKSATDPHNLNAATLGLVADDVVLSTSCPNDVTIDGVIMAGGANTTGGSFYYSDWNGGKRDILTLLGGIIQKKRGPVGTINGTALVSGYKKNYNYDPRMVNNPPPFYPTTGQYDVISWQCQ